MNWEIVQTVLTGILALAGCANYLMLMSIRLAISKQTETLKDWARGEFAGGRDTERRISDLERQLENESHVEASRTKRRVSSLERSRRESTRK